MSIATAIQAAQQKVADAYTAASAKGATMPATQNLSNLATTIGSISGGGGSKKYNLLDRVSDDSNNEIGTVIGFHIDANDVEYAVVCLDAAYRLASGKYLSNNVQVSGVPNYSDQTVYEAPETATTNCDAILATAQSGGLSSSAVSHCRAQTFTIDGVSYAGQLPTLMELLKIFEHRTRVNTADSTTSQYSSLIVPTGTNCWSSTQYGSSNAWDLFSNGATHYLNNKSNAYMVLPVLEIPNA